MPAIRWNGYCTVRGSEAVAIGAANMQATYYPNDDILELKFGDKPIVREISQKWNVNISYDAGLNEISRGGHKM